MIGRLPDVDWYCDKCGSSLNNTTLQVIKNYVFLQPIVHKPLG